MSELNCDVKYETVIMIRSLTRYDDLFGSS